MNVHLYDSASKRFRLVRARRSSHSRAADTRRRRVATVARWPDAFVPGAEWRDTNGETIEAHGGGILAVGKRFYWYGENHRLGSGNKTGISAYSSSDLLHWKNEGVVLPKDSLPERFRDRASPSGPRSSTIGAPSNTFMWMHLDANRYADASAGVAVSDVPPAHSESSACFALFATTTASARTARNCTSANRETPFATWRSFSTKTNERAYVFYASESNKTLYAVRLSDDYTDAVHPRSRGRRGLGSFRAAGARHRRRSRLEPSIT